jgi:hypothetical protein
MKGKSIAERLGDEKRFFFYPHYQEDRVNPKNSSIEQETYFHERSSQIFSKNMDKVNRKRFNSSMNYKEYLDHYQKPPAKPVLK